MTQPPAAWHVDPGDPSRLRWWDGRQWTGHTAPMPGMPGQQIAAYPAYPAYPTAAATVPTAHRVYRPARGLAVAAAGVVLLVVATEVVLTAISFPSYNRISNAMSQGHDGRDVFTAYDAFTLGQIGLEIVAYVLTSWWLSRARGNAEALNPAAPHARSRGWVWGGWICPVVAWWFPYQVVRDVLRATDSTGAPVGRWWAAFIVWGVSSNVLVRMMMDGVAPVVQVVSLVAAIVAASWWIAIVRRISRDQQAYASTRATGTD